MESAAGSVENVVDVHCTVDAAAMTDVTPSAVVWYIVLLLCIMYMAVSMRSADIFCTPRELGMWQMLECILLSGAKNRYNLSWM